MSWQTTIGLEVHVQLRTRTKLFCGCPAESGGAPNTHVCPVCLGYPGAMPVLNREAVRLTVLSGLMLDCRIAALSAFDRKSYFYPDMPKNYQITQYARPLCEGGSVEIPVEGGGTRRVALVRIHLEEDVAKNTHQAGCSGVDFNRAGVPLMEIVTAPDLHSPAEAVAFLQALRQTLLYAGVSDCNLEEGNLRCDVNISLRPAGQRELGTKVEIKNLNTFKGAHAALEAEIARQADALAHGARIVQETRRWDTEAGSTFPMRSKEDAHDYRYFPEPDLLPVALDAAQVEAWRAALPERPAARRERLVGEYGLTPYDAGVLAADRPLADFFEDVARRLGPGQGKTAANWIMTDVLAQVAASGRDIASSALTAGSLAELLALVADGTVNAPTAKALLPELFASGGSPRALVAARGLGQVRDDGAVTALVDEVLAAHPGPVADFLAGKQAAAGFLVGQVMKRSRGRADPKLAARLVAERLAGRRPGA